jgi:hypothetical protein
MPGVWFHSWGPDHGEHSPKDCRSLRHSGLDENPEVRPALTELVEVLVGWCMKRREAHSRWGLHGGSGCEEVEGLPRTEFSGSVTPRIQ